MSEDSSPEDLPPAYFLSLTLENVRCFGPEQTLDLTDEDGNPAQWTVLLGDNGTGKTTLMQAIAMMEPLPEYNEEDGSIMFYGPRFWTTDRYFSISKSLYREIDNEISINAKITREARRLAEKEFIVADNVGATYQRGEGGEATPLPPQSARRILCFAYGAARRMTTRREIAQSSDGEAEIFRRVQSLMEETPLRDAEEWLLQTDYAAKSGKKKAGNRREQIKAVLADPDSGILPDVDNLRFTEQEGDASPPRVEFHTHYGWVMIDQLSLGYRTMIAWVVDLARRLFDHYPESKNPLAEPAVCLVDEIDLHLHPKWQRKIIDFLSERFPNTQFIVTAHSPLVVQAAQDANIALLRRVEVEDGYDYVEIHNDMEPVGNLRVDQILTSDLYGLESARPPQLDSLLEERQEILSKSDLTDEDEERLEEIERKIGDLPSGETKEQREAMDFIKGVADRLEKEESTS